MELKRRRNKLANANRFYKRPLRVAGLHIDEHPVYRLP